MKNSCAPRLILRFVAAAALSGALSMNLGAAAQNILWTWDAANVLGSWGTAWGQAQTVQDPAVDNTGNGGGSIHVSTNYLGNPPDDNRNVITVMGNYGGWLWNGEVQNDLLDYESLEFDIRWDTATSTISVTDFNASGGDNGLAIWSARYDAAWEWITLDSILVPEAAASGWVHVIVPIDPTLPNLDHSAGIVFKKWIPQEVANAGGVAAFWIDNVELVAKQGPIEPPTMSLSGDVQQGLNLITLAGSQWQRQGIRTVGENFSWMGSPTPTTYEFTIRQVPAPAYADFQTHIFLVPRDPRTSAGPDWGQPDVVFFDMRVLGDGTFNATFRYKIDMPDANSFMFGEGALGTVTSSTARGRWGMTFQDGTNVTIFSPEGSTSFVLPEAAAAKFNDALTVYFGAQPNVPEYIGQKTVLAQAKIEGAVGGVNVTDNFPGPLDTNTWELAAENPQGIVILNQDAALWLSWTLPDTGFGLRSTGDLLVTDWAPFIVGAAPLLTGSSRTVLVLKSELAADEQLFWRMAQREFTKLQILLPGEVAAPGTPTGKTGTPDPQTLFQNFNVRVNAVDADWGVAPGATDTVVLTTTDTDPILPEPAALVKGSITLVVNLGTAGTHTITVSNETNPAMPSVTSAEFTVLEP